MLAQRRRRWASITLAQRLHSTDDSAVNEEKVILNNRPISSGYC